MLIFALSGGVATAGKLITGSQIKDGTIASKDLSSAAKRALKGSRGSTGPQGATGATGAPGAAGPSATGQAHLVMSAQVPFGSEVVQTATAFCPAGEKVVSGGGAVIGDTMNVTIPTIDRAGWAVIGVDITDNGGEYVQASAICAPTGKAMLSGASRADAKAQVARMAEKVGNGRTRTW